MTVQYKDGATSWLCTVFKLYCHSCTCVKTVQMILSSYFWKVHRNINGSEAKGRCATKFLFSKFSSLSQDFLRAHPKSRGCSCTPCTPSDAPSDTNVKKEPSGNHPLTLPATRKAIRNCPFCLPLKKLELNQILCPSSMSGMNVKANPLDDWTSSSPNWYLKWRAYPALRRRMARERPSFKRHNSTKKLA